MAIDTVPGMPADGAIDPGTEPATDEALVQGLIERSEDALAALYDRHGSAVFAAAIRAGGDRWIATEIVQETFLVLWNRADLFDPSRGTVAGWLATIARNRVIDRLRAAGRRDRATTFSSFARTEADEQSFTEWLTASGELIGAAGPEPIPDVALADKETRASIVEALGALDPLERQVIVLAYDRGLTQSEIAASLGWPIGTVKTRTRRALRHLRDRLEPPAARVTGRVAAVGRGDCFAPC